ncbi:uncharacterized protein LOC127417642 isoform X1 [Myxocyprinus asiaticus]|uniref:uncharacterized protein LOC127417642 isoform X1 n=1 Tax=Myxocyprinus asiaticus TaxID=70543 RepID=UPI0022232229|nr:uncharacterized protein LOC127417642 isoform X1 [Myxocyprinus asiaticus]
MATAEPETLTNPLSSEEETNNENRQEIVSLEDYIKHPLQNRWALWFFKNDKSKTWQANLRLISKFDTVEDFWAGAETREGGGMRCRGDLGAAIRQGSSHLPGDGGVAAGRREPEEPLPSTEEGEERFRPPGAGGLAAICRGRSELVSARGAVEVWATAHPGAGEQVLLPLSVCLRSSFPSPHASPRLSPRFTGVRVDHQLTERPEEQRLPSKDGGGLS